MTARWSQHLWASIRLPPAPSTIGHASPRAALRYQHATAKRDEAIADGIDRILDAVQDEGGGDVLRFRDRATGEGPATL